MTMLGGHFQLCSLHVQLSLLILLTIIVQKAADIWNNKAVRQLRHLNPVFQQRRLMVKWQKRKDMANVKVLQGETQLPYLSLNPFMHHILFFVLF